MRLSRLILAGAVLAVALTPVGARAQTGGTGLGIVLGEPTGVTARFMRGGNNFQVHGAWSFTDDAALQLSGDYLRSGRLDTEPMMPFYFGLGVLVKFASESQVGIRVPVGLNHFFKSDPFEIFGEVVPVLQVIPKTEFDLNAAVGVRYYFGAMSWRQ
ncbi:MAG: hypothetical protein PVJ04_14890 [Gemmatimonadota bacterium]|jgi:hypothetical protein